jgi:dTDP-4-amino-4,6-dideoxygalactose transaminase
LGAPHLVAVANGTLALHLGLRAFDLEGEVITTPFSFAATVTSVLWERCTPVFADINPDTFNLDPRAAQAAITERTSAVLATHVYGNPCDVVAFETLKRDAGCALLYDAAHAFGVRLDDKPVLAFGDASALSFHATKVFHTAEGGALVVQDDERRARVERLRNFGQSAPGVFAELGMNAKMSEVHAAVGLSVFGHLDAIVAHRQTISEAYDRAFAAEGPRVRRPRWHAQATRNYAYYPVILESEERMLGVVEALAAGGYQARRYFAPALNTLPYVTPCKCPIAEDVAARAICLPLHTEVSEADVEVIAGVVASGG